MTKLRVGEAVEFYDANFKLIAITKVKSVSSEGVVIEDLPESVVSGCFIRRSCDDRKN